MNVQDFIVNNIYHTCVESIDNISQESWDELNSEINQYLISQNIEENIDCKDIFSIKDDEYEKLAHVVESVFEEYPLIKTFLDENRMTQFPELDMIGIIRRWCIDFVNDINVDENMSEEGSYNNEISENIMSEGGEEECDGEYEDWDSEIDDDTDYITIKYFEGVFTAIYQLFMNREI